MTTRIAAALVALMSVTSLPTHAQPSPEAIEWMAKQAQAELDNIPLPIYQPSEITVHHPAGSASVGGSASAVDIAMFTTPDSVEDVLAFYQSELADFELVTQDIGPSFLVGQVKPGGSGPMDYLDTPHVLVSRFRGQDETIIQLGYRP